MEKIKIEQDSFEENVKLHYLFKGLFKSFISAGRRLIIKKIKVKGDYYSPETRAMYNAITQEYNNHPNKGIEFILDMRDVICVLSENQKFYHDFFKNTIKLFFLEIEKEKKNESC